MNVRISHTYKFMAVCHYDGQPTINEFTVVVSMITATDDAYQQNVAFDRMNYFFEEVMHGAALVAQDDTIARNMLEQAGFRTISLPSVPFDQIVGFALFSKLNVIMEGRLFVTDMETSSSEGKHVRYLLSDEEELGPLDCGGWWTDTSPSYCGDDEPRVLRGGNIVKMPDKTPDWDSLGLGWYADDDDGGAFEPGSDGNVVIVKFDSDEK